MRGIYLAIFIICSYLGYGQWQQSNPNYFSIGEIVNSGDSVVYMTGQSCYNSTGIFVSRDSSKSWKLLANTDIYSKLFFRNNYFVGYRFDSFSPCNNGIFMSSDFGVNWINISNGLYSGGGCSINAVTVTDSLIFCGNLSGHIFKRNYLLPNSGWVNITNGISADYILSLDNYNGIIYAGTNGNGFLVSTNLGQSWQQFNTNLAGNLRAEEIKIDPPNIYIVHLGMLYTSVIGNYNWMPQDMYGNGGGIYVNSDAYAIKQQYRIRTNSAPGPKWFYSTNGGVNWASPKNLNVNINPKKNYMVSTKFLSRVGESIYLLDEADSSWKSASYGFNLAAIADITKSNNKLLAIGKTGGLHSSLDSGKNWTPDYKFEGISSNSLLSYDSLVFVSTDKGLYKSSNHGSSWSFVNATAGQKFKKVIKKNNVLLAGTMTGVFLSNDNGNTWFSSATVFPDPVIHDFLVNSDTAFCATNKGIYKSIDDGQSWSLVNNILKDSAVYSIEQNMQTIYNTTSHHIYQSTNNLNTYGVVYSSNSKIINMIFSDSSIIVATENGCYIRKKNSMSWIYSSPYYYGGSYYVKQIDNIIFALSLLNGIYYIESNPLLTVGINEKNEESKKPDFEIFPIPASDHIQINFKHAEWLKMEIFSIEGKKVFEMSLRNLSNNFIVIDASFLSIGLYSIMLTDSEYKTSIKKIPIAR